MVSLYLPVPSDTGLVKLTKGLTLVAAKDIVGKDVILTAITCTRKLNILCENPVNQPIFNLNDSVLVPLKKVVPFAGFGAFVKWKPCSCVSIPTHDKEVNCKIDMTDHCHVYLTSTKDIPLGTPLCCYFVPDESTPFPVVDSKNPHLYFFKAIYRKAEGSFGTLPKTLLPKEQLGKVGRQGSYHITGAIHGKFR